MAHINFSDFVNLAGTGSDSVTKWTNYNWFNNQETINQVTKTFNVDSAAYAVKNVPDFSPSGTNTPFILAKQWTASNTECGYDDSTKSLILQGTELRPWVYLNGDASTTGKYRASITFKVTKDDNMPAFAGYIVHIGSANDSVKTDIYSNGRIKVSIKTLNTTIPFEFDKFHTLTAILDFDNNNMEAYIDGELVLSNEGPSTRKMSYGLSAYLALPSTGVLPYVKAYIKSMSIDKYIA